MAIDNFQKRQKAGYIYDTYFKIDSPHALDFDFFDTLNFYGVISEKESKGIRETMGKIRANLYKNLSTFDKKQSNGTKTN